MAPMQVAAVKVASAVANRVALVVAAIVVQPLAKVQASLTSLMVTVVAIAALTASPALPVVTSVNR